MLSEKELPCESSICYRHVMINYWNSQKNPHLHSLKSKLDRGVTIWYTTTLLQRGTVGLHETKRS